MPEKLPALKEQLFISCSLVQLLCCGINLCHHDVVCFFIPDELATFGAFVMCLQPTKNAVAMKSMRALSCYSHVTRFCEKWDERADEKHRSGVRQLNVRATL